MGGMARHDEHEWATRDVQWAIAFLALLALAGLNVLFLYVALAVLVAGATLAATRAVRRRHRQRANADAPFWADDLKGR